MINDTYLPYGPPQHNHHHRYPDSADHPNTFTKSTRPTIYADLANVRFLNLGPNPPTIQSLRPETSSTSITHRIESHHMNLTHILPPKDPPRLVRLPGPAANEEEQIHPEADVWLQEGNKQRNRLIDLLIYSCVALVADVLVLYLIWEWWMLW